MAAWVGLTGEGGVPALSTLLGQHPTISGQEFLLKADLIPRFSVFILCGDAMTSLLGQSVLGATLWECMPQQVRNTLSGPKRSTSSSTGWASRRPAPLPPPPRGRAA